LVDFALDDNFVHDRSLTDICRRVWSGPPDAGGLMSDLWVEGAFPSKVAHTLDGNIETLETLTQKGLFNAAVCAQLERTGAVPMHRPLYKHQRDAILAAQNSAEQFPALVVTAGTGAGKTESFLLPILNDLFAHQAQPGQGVQCLILYPMNALVNDQVDRLYSWLRGQSQVRVFHFTSETPEDWSRADRKDWGREDREVGPAYNHCRVRTRQQARGLETLDGRTIKLASEPRGQVPNILITNYSMLEYMLCRPQDAVFFGPALRAIVLDEAHLYTGTLAAEITLLLRRVMERCGRTQSQVLQIATSATIGGTTKDLRAFASTLFTKEESAVQVIQGQPTRVPLGATSSPATDPTPESFLFFDQLDTSTIDLDRTGNAVLRRDADLCDRLADGLLLLTDAATVATARMGASDMPAVLLYRSIGCAPLLHRIEAILWERRHLSLSELSAQLWGREDAAAVHATTILLRLGASARARVQDYPLVPHRLHLLARAPEGLSVCLHPHCSGPADRRLGSLGSVIVGVQDHCPYCQSATLSLVRCENCGEWALAGMSDQDHLKPIAFPVTETRTVFYLTLQTTPNATRIVIDPTTGKHSGDGAVGRPLFLLGACPRCGEEEGPPWKAFAPAAPLTLAILAESILAELPEYPSSNKSCLPARGRRILAFSDSRQEAARLGPRLTRQHEMQLVRAALVRCLECQRRWYNFQNGGVILST
jgi:hypothetical protein